MSKKELPKKIKRNKNATLAGLGFVVLFIILIIGAANFLRIQAFRFAPVQETLHKEYNEAKDNLNSEQPANMTPATKTQEATPKTDSQGED